MTAEMKVQRERDEVKDMR